MSLASARLDSLSKELPQLDGAIHRMTLHVRFLTASVEQIEERVLLETVNNLRRDVLEWGHRIEEVKSEIEGIKRSGARDTSSQGRLANVRGLSTRIQRSLLKLDGELQGLLGKAQARMNAPGRYGDAVLATGPIVDLFNMVSNVAEVLAKVLGRRKERSGDATSRIAGDTKPQLRPAR
jgi:hypothetical protein